MRNAKLAENLIGPEHWLEVPTIVVPGDSNAQPLKSDLSLEEKESIIQSWPQVAVFQVRREWGSGWAYDSFQIEFSVGDFAQYLTDPIQPAEGMFGMRVGPDETAFKIRPDQKHRKPVEFNLIEVVTVDDPKYKNLPLY